MDPGTEPPDAGTGDARRERFVRRVAGTGVLGHFSRTVSVGSVRLSEGGCGIAKVNASLARDTRWRHGSFA